MKKYILILLTLCLVLLASCDSADITHIQPVKDGFADTEYNDYSFTLRVEMGKKCVLLASGDVSVSDSPQTLTAEIEETFLGDNLGKSKITWKDGVLNTDGVNSETDWITLRSSMIYALPLVFDEKAVTKTESGSSLAGTIYRHYIKDNTNSGVIYDLLGAALPEICGVASVVKDESEFKNIVCEYIVSEDGTPVSYSISFTAVYQDTPPYIPGVKPDKSDYTVEVGVEFRINYN